MRGKKIPENPDAPQTTPREAWALVFLCAAAAFLSFFRLSSNNLWWDEFGNFSIARQGLQKLALNAVFIAPHPPLYFQLLHFVTDFGRGEFFLRLISAVCGTLSVPVFYLFGRAVAGRRAAFLGAVILAVSPLRIWYSQETTPHMMAFLFTLTANFQFYSFLRKPEAERPYILWILFTVLAFYTSNHSLLLLPAQAAYMLLLWKETGRPAKNRYFLGVALQLVLYIPQMMNLLYAIREVKTSFWIPRLGPSALPFTVMNFFLGYGGDLVMSWTVFALCCAGLALALRSAGSRVRQVFLAFGLFPLLAVFLLHPWIHVYIDRHNMIFMPAFFTAAAAGFLTLKSKAVRRACVGGVLAVMLLAQMNYWRNVMPLSEYGHVGVYIKKDVAVISRYLEKNARTRDMIAISCMNLMGPVKYYAPGLKDVCYLSAAHDPFWARRMDAYKPRGIRPGQLQATDVDLLMGRIVFLDSPEAASAALASLPERIWLVQTSWARDGSLSLNAERSGQILTDRYTVARRKWMDGVLVSLYVRRSGGKEGPR